MESPYGVTKLKKNKEALSIDIKHLYNARFIYPADYKALNAKKLGCDNCYIREEDVFFGSDITKDGYTFKIDRNADDYDAVCCDGQRIKIPWGDWKRIDFLGISVYGSHDDYFYLCRDMVKEPYKIGFSPLELPLIDYKDYYNNSMGLEREEIAQKSRVFTKYGQTLRNDVEYFHLYTWRVHLSQGVSAGMEILLPDNMLIYIFAVTLS
jgi:hypothetical protein